MGNCATSTTSTGPPEAPRARGGKAQPKASRNPNSVRNMSIGELKRELRAKNVDMKGMIEKEDLVQAVLTARGAKPKPVPRKSTPNYDLRSAPPKKKSAAAVPGRCAPPVNNKKPNQHLPRKTQGKIPKAGSNDVKPKPGYFHQQVRIDPAKWKFEEIRFNGSSSYSKVGREERVNGPVQQGMEEMRKHPSKYVSLWYQTNVKDWPAKNQQYTLIHREGTEGYQPMGVSPSGRFSCVFIKYERCTAFPNNELPLQFRDRYTDTMSYLGRRLHSAKNKPLMPGRGMGLGDAPDLKIIGDVDPSDIHQGSVGDCWLLSAISALAEFDGAVKQLFRKTPNLDRMPLDGPNKYIVSLYDLSSWREVDVVIDERLCVQSNGRLLGAAPSEDGELWVCYLEKALAAHCGGWDKIKGGQCTHGWALMTGCKHQYTVRKNKATGKYACYAKYNSLTGRWSRHANSPHDCEQAVWQVAWPDVGGGGTQELTQEELFLRMCAWDDENYIVGASVDGVSDKNRTDGMVNNHAYSVIEAHDDVAGTPIDLFKVRNPWGKGEIENGEFDDDGPGWNRWPQVKRALKPVVADDGIFYLTKKEFFHHFSTIYLSASNMSEFLED